MLQIFLTLIFLFLLFLLCKKISQNIYLFFYLFTGSQKTAVYLLAFILLPGTIIHEMAHFLLATLLRVPTGEMTVIPTIEKNGEVKAGRLMIGEVDPFRRSIVGLAPIIIGLILIYFVGFYLPIFPILNTKYLIPNTLSFYLLFIVSNTMFSSKKDLESLAIALPIGLIVLFILYALGVRLFLEENIILTLDKLLQHLNFYLILGAILDFVVLIILTLLIKLFQKITKRKLVK